MTTMQAIYMQKERPMKEYLQAGFKMVGMLLEPEDSTGAGRALEYGRLFGVAKTGFWYAMSFALTSVVVGLS